MSDKPRSVELYGETPITDSFAEKVEDAFEDFNSSSKEKPTHVGLYAGVALSEIAGEARMAILDLEVRLNKLEDSLIQSSGLQG